MPALDFFVNRLDASLICGVGGEIIKRLVAELIAGADFDRVEPVQHVNLGERNAGDARHRDRLAHQHGVEPAAAALAARDGAEFMAALAEPLSGIIVEFGRERPRPHARRISLGDAQHETDRRRAKAGATRRCSGNRVRGCHERIGAVVNVEQCALRAFEQDALARLARFVEHDPDGLGKGQHEGGDLAQIIEQARAVDRRLAKTGAQRVMMRA